MPLNPPTEAQGLSAQPLSALTIARRAECAAIGDFLERPGFLFDDRAVDAVTVIAMRGESPAGWIRFYPRRLVQYIAGTVGVRMRSAAIIDFPVTGRLDSAVWLLLYDAALGALFETGIAWSVTHLPKGANGAGQFLEQIGYGPLGEAPPSLSNDGLYALHDIYIRKCTAARGFIRPDLTPEYSKAPVLTTATVSTAPRPERTTWESQVIYSGYSGYPWLSHVLERLLDPGATLLSVPCGTGDLFRLLPASMISRYRRGVGVDFLDRNTSFARARLIDPNVDLVNMALNCFFGMVRKGYWPLDEARQMFESICNVAGRLMVADESTNYFGQICAIHRESVRGGAITDWWAASKALATLLLCSPTPSVVRSSGRTVADVFTRCVEIARLFGRDIFDHMCASLLSRSYFEDELTRAAGIQRIEARTEFVNEDMFTMNLSERFDVVFVWEATLMTAGVGREIEFVENLLRHVRRGGCLVLTGIRSPEGRIGQELMTVGSAMSKMGCQVYCGSIRPRASRWAISYAENPRFPYLVSVPSGEI
jgi:hypothetical protein